MTRASCFVLLAVLGAGVPARAEDGKPAEAPAAPGISAPAGLAPNAIAPVLSRVVFPATVKVYGAGGFVGIPAYGTGVVVDPNGVIATAWSISLRTENLRVVLDDGRRLDARLWRADPKRGLALLRVDAKDLPAIPFGDGGSVRTGDQVYAIGNAFDDAAGDEKCAVFGGVVEAVAALDVRVGIEDGPPLGTVIVVDSPSNPGTQGGPLVTREGKLVGIMGRILESKSTNTIVSYAVPVATLAPILRDALDGKEPAPEAAARKGVPVETGIRLLDANLMRSPPAWVDRVLPGSPADKAGVKPDDLVFRLDGRVVRSCRAFDDLLRDRVPGDKVQLLVKRGAAVLELELTLVARKEN